jgi:hypothetical protein
MSIWKKDKSPTSVAAGEREKHSQRVVDLDAQIGRLKEERQAAVDASLIPDRLVEFEKAIAAAELLDGTPARQEEEKRLRAAFKRAQKETHVARGRVVTEQIDTSEEQNELVEDAKQAERDERLADLALSRHFALAPSKIALASWLPWALESLRAVPLKYGEGHAVATGSNVKMFEVASFPPEPFAKPSKAAMERKKAEGRVERCGAARAEIESVLPPELAKVAGNTESRLNELTMKMRHEKNDLVNAEINLDRLQKRSAKGGSHEGSRVDAFKPLMEWLASVKERIAKLEPQIEAEKAALKKAQKNYDEALSALLKGEQVPLSAETTK